MRQTYRLLTSCLLLGLLHAHVVRAALDEPGEFSHAKSVAETPRATVSLLLESIQHLAEARGAITARRFAPAWESIERAKPLLHSLKERAPRSLARTEGLVAAAQKALEKKDFARADSALERAEETVRANVLAENDKKWAPLAPPSNEGERSSHTAE